MNLKRFLLATTTIFVLIVSVSDISANSNITVHKGFHSGLINKYWQIQNSHKNKQYFYFKKNHMVAKHTALGSYSASDGLWMKKDNVFVVSAWNSNDIYNSIWWFIKPNKNMTESRVGYTKIPINKYPSHQPAYYLKMHAKRVSAVTAQLG